MSKEELVDKMVIDNSGNIIGKCIDFRDNDEDENILIVKVKSKEKGEMTIDIPMSTIQAIGKTIVLAVEIEGLVEDEKLLPYDEELETDDDIEAKMNKDIERVQKDHKSQQWTLYKSIKSHK